MKIVINSRVLSLPPYLSTSWENISSLYLEEERNQKNLIVFLNSGSQVKIPDLDNGLIDAIFTKHAQFLDQNSKPANNNQPINSQAIGSDTLLLSPFKLGDINLDMLNTFMQHNIDQKNAPNLPREILEKIQQIMKMMPKEEIKHLPKAEPHCNCLYCQISRSLTNQPDEEESQGEVTDEDLRFKEWDIAQIGEALYVVTNPLDKTETFQVFLGKTIGCTCGKKTCEHIEAVLHS